MDLATLEKELEQLERRYQEWVEPINQVIREKSFQVNRDGYTPGDFRRDVNQIREEQRAKYDPYQEIYAFLDQLCPAYLTATPQERAAIRSAVSEKNGVLSALLGYVYKSAKQIRSGSGEEWLRRGLAAISIENCRKDFRDVLLALAELYVAAEEAGIKPQPEFRAVARLSSREKPRGGTTPVSKMLANFSKYGALKERRRKSQESKQAEQ
jgi:hypothetical protein